VIGADTVNTGITGELGGLVEQHLRALIDRIETVRGALFVVTVESNMGYVAGSLEEYFRKTPTGLRVHVLREDPRKARSGAVLGGGAVDLEPVFTAGRRTTNALKRQMVDVMRTLLRGELVFFARHVVSAHLDKRPLGAALPREELIGQMLEFKRELTFPANRNRTTRPRAREVFSGKYGGSKRDDWVMALLIVSLTVELWQRTTLSEHASRFARM
jgi:hypothetical protein